MASGKGDWLENAVCLLYNGTNITAPANVYLSLHTASVGDSGSGAEVSGGSYVRLQKATTSGNFTVSANTITNAATFTWADATANWGTVTSVGIWSALSGGNLLHWGDLTASKTINSGDRFEMLAGELDITED